MPATLIGHTRSICSKRSSRILFEIHGDRRYADDPAIVCGFAKLGDVEVCLIGQQKGPRYETAAASKFCDAETRRLPKGASGDEARR
jgi:acetyl-CoA carboxylase alpha subunit